MINFRRAMPPPKKLQERSFEGVKNCLIEMQANKCYMCERKAPDSSQIEHFIPVSKGSEELKFSWENLFLACGHCNSIKNHVSDRQDPALSILNCTDYSTIITDAIHFQCEGKPRERVIIKSASENPTKQVLDTIKLLDQIFNYNSESLAFDAKVLTDEVIQEMKKLLDLLHTYEFNSHSISKKEGIKNDIKDALSVESPFTAFKIWYIKRYFSNSEFDDLLPIFEIN
ncbi:MAG: HNH endonuclease [Saprospiraceae bacterium]|nr:HNH endonuclease [Saprospiraceae bacterium]MCB9308467.1 HNH endonuclease [Lewinellaceae bacterium]